MTFGHPGDFRKCEKPDCLRQVKQGVVYCCTPCALAADGGYEIHEDGPLGHTRWCDERAAERGPWLTLDQLAAKLAAEHSARQTTPPPMRHPDDDRAPRFLLPESGNR